MASVRLSVRTLFPSPCGQPVRGSPGACVSQPLRAALASAASRWRNAAAAGRGSRPSSVPGTPGWAVVSGPACTTLRQQGCSVARAESPRHRHPRLRHRTRRRGTTSAASSPPARARVSKLCASQRSGPRIGQCSHAQKDAARLDCPHGPLGCQATFRPPVGSATRANGRCALPPRSSPQGAQKGRHRHRCALPVPLIPATPQAPLGGSADRLPLLPLVLCGLSSLLASVWNVMPRGSCVKAWPRCAHQQDGSRGLTTSEGRRAPSGPQCWRTQCRRGLAGSVGATVPPTPAGRCAPL
jgi:hypothetical protein